MQQQVVYVQASESDPNTSEILAVCRRMAEEGFARHHAAPSQGEGGVTVGLWLFFSGLHQAKSVTEGAQTEAGTGSWWSEFREERKGLGGALTITGVASGIIGVLLHFALTNNFIETNLHLGFLFGIVGLLLFLPGLLIVF